MLSPTQNYRMSKQSKILLANAWNRPNLGQYRRSLIQADIASRQVVGARRERREND